MIQSIGGSKWKHTMFRTCSNLDGEILDMTTKHFAYLEIVNVIRTATSINFNGLIISILAGYSFKLGRVGDELFHSINNK